ncbi:hypothetical protein PTSG_04018 [Salpingoeca rosetta]|uniref:Uncharacterized protein n=1 Tax=Salpingoeca rosetta (strain ATCC 50818 / BSB-021) TaxID=946362 RepID=F2U7J4_SALR5|nr:uncharacterized protein PTSG_04018 [Salpingoeca rosetta]EGD83411.1 hypothetical protein PTSG_04018 [Salpingoeca rosetta]|eukprot:XP_004994915.1 hypothetical protein PTSG_04018 [Salpingoeca rosetta]
MGHKRRSRGARTKQNDLVGTQSERASRALRNAVSKADYEAMLGAVDDGADVNFADEKGRTALHFAAAAGRDTFVQFLISQGADPNKQDSNGNTALHLAACTNNIKVITALVDGGCDINMRDGKGRTPIHFAQSHLQLLRRYSSDPEAYRGKVLDVVNLLLAYSRRHNREAVEGLNDLVSRISTHSLDELEDVLGEFVNMSLASLE